MANRAERRRQAKELGIGKRYANDLKALVIEAKDLHNHKGKFLRMYVGNFFRTFILGSSLTMFDTGYELAKLTLNVFMFILLFIMHFVKWCLVIVFLIPLFLWFMTRAWIKIGRVAKEEIHDD